MREIELKELWKGYDQKLNQSLALNRVLFEEVKKNKVNGLLNSIRPNRIFAIIVGVLWVLLIDAIIVVAFKAGGYFQVGSLAIHSIVTKIAIGISIYHLVLINEINDSDSVIEVQNKIAKFRMTTLTTIRLSLLQLPIFTTFYITPNMISEAGIGWWIFQLCHTIMFFFAGIWSYNNFKMENSSKKWFKFFFGDKEWKSLQKADDILVQIDEMKSEE